jgi:hypothetical protein
MTPLIYEIMDKCAIMNHVRVDDAYGSWTDTWTEGATFDASIIKNSTTEATVAERQGIKEIFTVVVKKDVPLSYHDVFKRKSDGAIFRVTSESKDSEAPARSTVKIAKVTAERWELTSAEDSGST